MFVGYGLLESLLFIFIFCFVLGRQYTGLGTALGFFIFNKERKISLNPSSSQTNSSLINTSRSAMVSIADNVSPALKKRPAINSSVVVIKDNKISKIDVIKLMILSITYRLCIVLILLIANNGFKSIT